MTDWDPQQYHRYRQERSQPAYDLMDFVSPRNSMRIVDLGCGTGEHTKTLHERFRAIETIGIDASAEMLSKAPRSVGGLKFYQHPIEGFGGDSEFDLIFSNAALQWVGDHPTLFSRFHRALRPGGQVAIQVPCNWNHPSHSIARELGNEPPYDQFAPCPLDVNTLAPEGYAGLLHRLGYRAIKVRLFVYLHELESGEETVEWMMGSLLNHYRKAQPANVYKLFEMEYRNRVTAAIGAERPYLFTFNRILMHAVR